MEITTTDSEGLDQAYSTTEGLYSAGDTLYIAGTKSAGDVLDDLSIPLGLTNTTARHRDASRVLVAIPQFSTLVGHSLGGAVALQLQKENPELKTRTYGAPVASVSGSGERYRHWGDPVAMFDLGAQTTVPRSLNPHSYAALASEPHKKKAGPDRKIA